MKVRDRVQAAMRALFGYPEPENGRVPDWRASLLHHNYQLDPIAWDFPKAYRLVATIQACIRRRSSDMASQPVTLERETSTGWEPIKRAPENIVDVWHSGNPRQTGREVTRDWHSNFAIHGNGYLVAEDFGMRRVSELWVMPSHLVTPIPGIRRQAEAYVFNRGGHNEVIPARNVIAWQEFQPEDEPVGLSKLYSVQLQYETRHDLMRMFQKVVRRGGVGAGFFHVPQPTNGGAPIVLSDADKEAIAKQLKRMRSALDSDIILDTLVYDRTGLTMQEMQFMENANLSDADICRALDVPPWLIGIKEGAKLGDSGQSASADERIYWMNLRSELEMRDAILTEKLVPMFPKDAGVRFRTDLSAVPALNAPLLNAAQQAVALAGRPVLTVNEVRRLNALPPVDDPEADELYTAPVPTIGGDGLEGKDAPAKDNSKPAAKAKRDMDDPERAERWRAKDKIMARYERKFEAAFSKLVRERKAELLRRLEQDGIRSLQGKRAVNLDAVFEPDPEEERKINAIYEALIAERGTEAAKEIALELEVNLHTQSVRQFIERRKSLGLDGALDTLMQDVRMSLAEGVGLNESLTELAARVSSYMDQAEQGRVLTIARTETVSAFNFATREAWAQTGEVEAMEWLTARDSVVRDSHAEADGQVGSMASGFEVGGASLAYPGDPSGPPEETINCRCTLLPVLSERARRARKLSIYYPSKNGHSKPESRLPVGA